MKRKITVASLAAIIALVVIVVATSTDNAVSQGSTAKLSDVGYVVFEQAAPRSTGEKEFYFVLKDEDKAMAQIVANAFNETVIPYGKGSSMGVKITNAKVISGNMIHVPVPSMARPHAGLVVEQIANVEITRPAQAVKEAPITTEALIMLANLEDQDVRLNALIGLSRKDTIGAYRALKQAYSGGEGWTKRFASLGLALYEKANETTLKQMRKEFQDAYQSLQSLLQQQPRTLQEFQTRLDAMKAEVDKMIAVAPPAPPTTKHAPKTMQTDLNSLVEAINMIKQYYRGECEGEINDETLMAAAMKGISDYLDLYSSLFDKETKKKWDSHMNAEFVGIGVTLERNDEGKFIIASPIFGSPAYKAGILARDVIVSVDGKDVQGLEMDELRKIVTGKPGTVVNIGIMRKGWKEPKVFPITREKIEMPMVLYKMMPGNVGYLRLLQFGNGSFTAFAKAVQDLQRQNLKGLVIDLRNNPGGSLREILNMANMFLMRGQKIASMKGAPGSRWAGQTWHASNPNPLRIPLTVLTNGASASASEMFTGAMKYNNRATIIGQKTFGKGCGQSVLPLQSSNGKWFLKITVFNYYLPNDECINKNGIEPNIPLEVEEIPEWKTDAIGEMGREPFDKYIDAHINSSNEAAFKKLAEEGDDFDCSKYPGFDKFYESLDTKLTKQDIRKLLRHYVRAYFAGKVAKPYQNDLQEDTELQRAIYEVLKKMGLDPGKVEGFDKYAKDVEKRIEEAAKKKADEKEAPQPQID